MEFPAAIVTGTITTSTLPELCTITVIPSRCCRELESDCFIEIAVVNAGKPFAVGIPSVYFNIEVNEDSTCLHDSHRSTVMIVVRTIGVGAGAVRRVVKLQDAGEWLDIGEVVLEARPRLSPPKVENLQTMKSGIGNVAISLRYQHPMPSNQQAFSNKLFGGWNESINIVMLLSASLTIIVALFLLTTLMKTVISYSRIHSNTRKSIGVIRLRNHLVKQSADQNTSNHSMGESKVTQMERPERGTTENNNRTVDDFTPRLYHSVDRIVARRQIRSDARRTQLFRNSVEDTNFTLIQQSTSLQSVISDADASYDFFSDNLL